MIGKCAGARQLDFVTPPRPTQTGAGGQAITHLAAVPAYPCASITPNPDEIRQFHPAPANSPMRLNRQLRPSYAHATDATPFRYEKIVTDTKSVARPYLTPRHCPPKTPAPRHDEIRQLYPAPQIPVIHHPFDTCVSYGPAMTIRQIRHLSDTNNFSSDTKSVEMSNGPLSGLATPPAQDSLSTPRRNPPTSFRPSICRGGTTWSNTGQLRQWNEWNPFQIQITRPQLRTEFHSLSGAGPLPAPNNPVRPTTKSINFQSANCQTAMVAS